MKNQKGLTLVELLATLVILALVLGIIIPNVSKSVRNKKHEITNYQEKIIEEATESYITDEINNNNNLECATKNISVNTLIENGYLDDDYDKFKSQQVKVECIKKSDNDIYKYTLIKS